MPIQGHNLAMGSPNRNESTLPLIIVIKWSNCFPGTLPQIIIKFTLLGSLYCEQVCNNHSKRLPAISIVQIALNFSKTFSLLDTILGDNPYCCLFCLTPSCEFYFLFPSYLAGLQVYHSCLARAMGEFTFLLFPTFWRFFYFFSFCGL